MAAQAFNTTFPGMTNILNSPSKKTGYPRKAMILAAGFGERMRPLSYDTPKPLLPLWNRPLLDHTLDTLAGWGVRDVIINLHYQPGDILEHLRRRPATAPRVNLSFEPDILGIGGALRRADWFFDDQPFWLINADVAFRVDAEKLVDRMRAGNFMATLWLTDQAGPRTVEMRKGLVTCFRTKTPAAPSTYTFTGLHLLSPRILDALPLNGYASIITAYEKTIAEGGQIAGVCRPGSYWNDLGVPARYIQAHTETQEKAVLTHADGKLCMFQKRYFQANRCGRLTTGSPSSIRSSTHLEGEPLVSRLSPAFEQCLKSYHTDLNRTTKNFAAVARDAHIDTGADINNAVIWSGARIGPAAVVRGAIIGRNCIINHTVPYIAVSAAYLRHDPALHAALAHLDWPHEQTAVIPLEPRGSARTFTRLTNGKHSVIMVNYSLERTENAYYARHIRLLKECGVETPRLLLEHPRRKLLLLEDIGGISLETLANRKSQPGELCNLYRETLDNLLRMHTAGTRMAHRRRHRMTAAFSPRLYKWEREFFAKHFLSQYTGCTAADTRAILAEIRISAVQLHNGPQCLIHRDMQSTNVLFRRAQPVFIDFQGMRFGPPAYDLASLLCDPYVELPEEIINASLEYYNNNAPRNLQVSAALFQHAAVERLAQALGAFGRLGANPATVRFKRFTPPALRRLALVLEQMDSYPVLTSIIHQTLAKHNI